MHHQQKRYYLPLLFAFLLLTGIYIGSRIRPAQTGNNWTGESRNTTKINDLISYIEDSYVDTINKQALYDAAISGLLHSLDPHSQYIPAADFSAMMDPLRGNFEGIGIQFRLYRDTVTVVSVITGGPSEKAGLLAGDRLVKIDNKDITRQKLSNNDVIKQLKGPKGSQVEVDVFRRGEPGLLHFSLSRDVIPTFSAEVAYMINENTGYIKLARFSATTAKETTEALIRLKELGMQKLILDLRDNAGGFLQAAIDIAGEFLPGKQTIVYTQGRKRPRQTYFSSGNGLFTRGELVVLIDEGSASASEILAGTVQDNDRGMVLGRRSFGKGLVQEEIDFKDGSAVRLTVAKYYTPTGRCIQREFSSDTEEYNMEPYRRIMSGEDLHPDSIAGQDTIIYRTPKGKIVYGGGGITPDVYIPVNRDDDFRFIHQLSNSGIINQFAFEHVDQHRQQLSAYPDLKTFIQAFQVNDQMLKTVMDLAVQQSLKPEKNLDKSSQNDLRIIIKSLIARILFDDEGYYQIHNQRDKTVLKALELLSGK